MLLSLTVKEKAGERRCRRKTIYAPNRLKLIWRVCLDGNMQIAAGNGNLKNGRADEGRDMLINDLKLDKISQGDITQGQHMERQKDRTTYIWEARRERRARKGAVGGQGNWGHTVTATMKKNSSSEGASNAAFSRKTEYVQWQLIVRVIDEFWQ